MNNTKHNMRAEALGSAGMMFGAVVGGMGAVLTLGMLGIGITSYLALAIGFAGFAAGGIIGSIAARKLFGGKTDNHPGFSSNDSSRVELSPEESCGVSHQITDSIVPNVTPLPKRGADRPL
ncbi:hypothetical protein [Tautonia marina]|uniref:hypothetical protein n=1 Tax=Tautonia marina TaxID=2653855 RepID=UPI001260BEC5|nr:hypothetical protein [Tautonia marina]